MSTELIEKLNATREALVTRGWRRTLLCDEDGHVCLLGAAALAEGIEEGIEEDNDEAYGLDTPLVRALQQEVRQYPKYSGASSRYLFREEETPTKAVWIFNDDQISEGPVLELIDRAIQTAQQEEL